MKKVILERNLAVLMFVMVIITFSFADRDTKKLEKLYSYTEAGGKILLAQISKIEGAKAAPEQDQ